MTVIDPDTTPVDEVRSDLRLGDAADRVGASEALIDDLPPAEDDGTEEELAAVSPLLAAAAAFLATAGVGWMFGGIFAGGLFPRLVGITGALVGAGAVAVGTRLRNPTPAQMAGLPLGVLLGLVLVGASGAGASVPTLVLDAIRAGGLSQPPVPFDPGWRFILVVLPCATALMAATGAVSFGRARLAVFLPAPLMVAGAMIQPDGKELTSVLPALVLFVAGLAVAFGGEFSGEDGSTGFEARRLGKAGGFLAATVVALIGVSQLGFLFPPVQDSSVIPPKRPETPPPVDAEQLLFTVGADELVPLRLGVLDVYDGSAWLTPPYDPKRFVPVGDANLPVFGVERLDDPGAVVRQPTPESPVEIHVRIEEPGPAREVPDVAGTFAVDGAPSGTEFDPRSQTLRLPGRARPGTSYVVQASPPPDGAAMSEAPSPQGLEEFLDVPPPPAAVRGLLDAVPDNLDAFERLQAVRTAYYNSITALGPGKPVDVPPGRVEAFITGTPASPYEITAAEVLMARWAGVPARLGYGYYNSDAEPNDDGRFEIYAADGAMWLEAYFEGVGWVPILGKPPRAQSNIDDANNDENIAPNGLISAQLYIPIRQVSLTQLYEIVQFWLVRALVLAALVVSFWILLPGLLKRARRVRRRRWAAARGPRARLAVVYAEIRDRAIDLNIGHPTLTPLQFLDILEPDDDHSQLAWLVTRGLWGDLARDLREPDVELAEQWARSIDRRFAAGQPYLMRTLAFGSRVSLRDPWSAEMPNLYPRWRPWTMVTSRLRTAAGRYLGWVPGLGPRLRRPAPRFGHLSVLLVALLALGGCAQDLDLETRVDEAAALPTVPAEVAGFVFEPTDLGDSQFEQYRDIALIADYDLYVVRHEGLAVGTLQTSTFKPGLQSRNREVRKGVLDSLGGVPEVAKVGGETIYRITINDVVMLVWFAPDGLTYELLAATGDLDDPEDLLARLVAHQTGRADIEALLVESIPPADARRGPNRP